MQMGDYHSLLVCYYYQLYILVKPQIFSSSSLRSIVIEKSQLAKICSVSISFRLTTESYIRSDYDIVVLCTTDNMILIRQHHILLKQTRSLPLARVSWSPPNTWHLHAIPEPPLLDPFRTVDILFQLIAETSQNFKDAPPAYSSLSSTLNSTKETMNTDSSLKNQKNAYFPSDGRITLNLKDISNAPDIESGAAVLREYKNSASSLKLDNMINRDSIPRYPTVNNDQEYFLMKETASAVNTPCFNTRMPSISSEFPLGVVVDDSIFESSTKNVNNSRGTSPQTSGNYFNSFHCSTMDAISPSKRLLVQSDAIRLSFLDSALSNISSANKNNVKKRTTLPSKMMFSQEFSLKNGDESDNRQSTGSQIQLISQSPTSSFNNFPQQINIDDIRN